MATKKELAPSVSKATLASRKRAAALIWKQAMAKKAKKEASLKTKVLESLDFKRWSEAGELSDVFKLQDVSFCLSKAPIGKILRQAASGAKEDTKEESAPSSSSSSHSNTSKDSATAQKGHLGGAASAASTALGKSYGVVEMMKSAMEKKLRVDLVVNFTPFKLRLLDDSREGTLLVCPHFPCSFRQSDAAAANADDDEAVKALEEAFTGFYNTVSSYFQKPQNGENATVIVFGLHDDDIPLYMIARYLNEEYGLMPSIGLQKLKAWRGTEILSKSLRKALFAKAGEVEGERDSSHKAGRRVIEDITATKSSSSRGDGEAFKRPKRKQNFAAPAPRRLDQSSSSSSPPSSTTGVGGASGDKRRRIGSSDGHDAAASHETKAGIAIKDHPYLLRVKEPHLRTIRQKLADLIQAAWGGQRAVSDDAIRGSLRRRGGGENSVTVERLGVIATRKREFRISWLPKAPCLYLLILKEGCFVVDESLACYNVPKLEFRHRKNTTDRLRGWLCKGELVVDVIEKGGGVVEKKPRFLITDLLVMNRKGIYQLPHTKRHRIAQVDLVDCRAMYAKIVPRPQVSIRMKQMFPVEKLRKVLGYKIPHETEGITFIAASSPHGKSISVDGVVVHPETVWVASENDDISKDRLLSSLKL